MNSIWTPDPRLDLIFERVVDVPRERVWEALDDARAFESMVLSGSVDGIGV